MGRCRWEVAVAVVAVAVEEAAAACPRAASVRSTALCIKQRSREAAGAAAAAT